MSPEALSAWENRDVISLDRPSDHAEAESDERQDAVTSLNFPLHWTSATLSKNYLFDVAIACELLAPRPDNLVLDFAAGTCWATELLGRLGVRTVSIDLSLEMMRRGRQRLAADSRLVFRDQAGFVAARGQALPFADASFDGVLCMNALHHLPSYAAALRDIHRVLKPGGRAVFSEPGTAHAVQALSQFRMREERIVEKSVSLPLVRRLAMEAGFSRMRVVPLRSPGPTRSTTRPPRPTGWRCRACGTRRCVSLPASMRASCSTRVTIRRRTRTFPPISCSDGSRRRSIFSGRLPPSARASRSPTGSA